MNFSLKRLIKVLLEKKGVLSKLKCAKKRFLWSWRVRREFYAFHSTRQLLGSSFSSSSFCLLHSATHRAVNCLMSRLGNRRSASTFSFSSHFRWWHRAVMCQAANHQRRLFRRHLQPYASCSSSSFSCHFRFRQHECCWPKFARKFCLFFWEKFNAFISQQTWIASFMTSMFLRGASPDS